MTSINQQAGGDLPDLTLRAGTTSEQSPDGAWRVVVVIHGRGSDADDLLGLASYFGPGWLVIAPQAPFPVGPGYQWYEVLEVGVPEQQGFDRSLAQLRQLLDAIPTAFNDVNPREIFLLGFSQGAVMSFALGLTQPQAIAGIAGLSGYIARQTQEEVATIADLRGLPVLVTHGTLDRVIGVSFGRAAREWLTTAGVDLEYHEYPMGHEINRAALNDLVTWLNRQRDDRQSTDDE